MTILLRNPEVRRVFLLQCIIGAGAAILFAFWEIRFGLCILALSCIFIALYLAATARRYQRLNEFAADIDRILHGSDPISLENYAEGELSILHSEIHKMISRLTEQQQALLSDKVLLANSIADISHQIRTPLTSIHLQLSLLNDPALAPEKRQQLLFELRELLSRIDWLVTTLLKISQLDAGVVQFKSEPLLLADLVQTALSPLVIPMELRGITLSVDAEGSITGDAAWTREAIVNIAKNCMEHTPAGGKIEIAARENALFSEITLSDTGKGIAAEDLPHIFDRFYKGADSGEKSFGIGLSLARMIITAQNGTIRAENRASGGASFTIRFYKSTI